MKLNQLLDKAGARKSRMRVGRGIGSGKGKTCGRGVKGQKSRSGVSIKGFEGGQMPLYQRMPKRGFNNPTAKTYAVINLDTIQSAIDRGRLDVSKTVDKAVLIESGVVSKARDGIRILGRGELQEKVKFFVSAVSATARQAIEKSGGSVELIPVKTHPKGKKAARKEAARLRREGAQ